MGTTSATTTSPIRVAIIGLSASATATWAADAHLPALQSAQGRKLFQLVALCNSSVEAAKAAIKHYNLDLSVKAYGNSQDLANDPDIDLMICSTRVDKHYDNITPSIKAGKNIYVEWPVASTTKHVKEIVELAQKHKVKVAVGVQGRYSPPVQKLKEILEGGQLGKLLSSELRVSGGSTRGVDTLYSGWEYFADKKLGGNHVTILFGHAIDQVQTVVGSYVKGTTVSQSQSQYNKVRIINGTGETINTIDCDSPDLLYVTGTISPSPFVTTNATLSASYHREWAFPGQSTLTWTMNLEKGIVRLDVTAYPSLQADAYNEPVPIRIWHFGRGDDVVENVPWSRTEEALKVSQRARDTLGCLVAFASGDQTGWVDIAQAVNLTEQLESWIDGKPW